MAKILIYSPNVIGKAMAGPAIRSWEFAKALSSEHQVILIAPNTPEIKGDGFTLMTKQHPLYSQHFKQADVMITQALTCSMALQAKRHQVKIIIDAYDPVPLESLEQFKSESLFTRYEKQFSAINNIRFNFQMANGIICASEKQRDLWIGLLLGQKLITPLHYEQDNRLRAFIDTVPFGLSRIPPQKNRARFEGKIWIY